MTALKIREVTKTRQKKKKKKTKRRARGPRTIEEVLSKDSSVSENCDTTPKRATRKAKTGVALGKSTTQSGDAKKVPN